MASGCNRRVTIILLVALLAGCSDRTTSAPNSEKDMPATNALVNEALLAASSVEPNKAVMIAFLSDREYPGMPSEGELFLMDPTGEDQHRLSCALGIAIPGGGDLAGASGKVSWSSSMQSFLLSFGDLVQVNLRDNSRESLELRAFQIDVAANGITLAASTANAVTGGDIVVLQLDGSKPITVTDGMTRFQLALRLDTPFWAPAISPNGRQVSFIAPRQLLLVDVDSRAPRELADNITVTGQASWSPDGEQIAVPVRDREGTSPSLKILSVATGVISQLVSDGQDPAWSPDGKSIVFTRSDNQIWSVNADGTEMRQLTSVSQNCCPMWVTNPEVLTPYIKTECVKATPTLGER